MLPHRLGDGVPGSLLSLMEEPFACFYSFTGHLLESTPKVSQNGKFSVVSITSGAFCRSVDLPFSSWDFHGEDTNSMLRNTALLTASPWRSAAVITTLTLGLVLIIAFFIWENFAAYPMIPGYVFKNKVSRPSKLSR